MSHFLQIAQLASATAVTSIILALLSGQATAQTLDKSRICLEMSRYAKKFFVSLQEMDNDLPDERALNVEGARQFNFDKYKKHMAAEGPSPAPGVPTLWEIQRQWGEIGINEYVSTPDASSEAVERRIYERCITSKAP